MGFSEVTENVRSFRTKKLFFKKREMVEGNLTSASFFSHGILASQATERRQREVHAFQGKVKEK